ncbi:MAG: PadR family transcriptional regulator [Patescibacteria group bacterium]
MLAVLFQDAMYGYQIIKSIKNRSHDVLEFGEGTIYPALHAMGKDGLLKSEWRNESNFPQRKYYFITPKGKRVLKENVKEWQSFVGAINQIYAKI